MGRLRRAHSAVAESSDQPAILHHRKRGGRYVVYARPLPDACVKLGGDSSILRMRVETRSDRGQHTAAEPKANGQPKRRQTRPQMRGTAMIHDDVVRRYALYFPPALLVPKGGP